MEGEATQFFRALFRQRNGLLWVARGPLAGVQHSDDWQGKGFKYSTNPKDAQFDELEGYIERNLEKGHDLYYCTSLLNILAKRRAVKEALPTNIIAQEFDASYGPLFLCEPHIIVETSPGHTHDYWLLDELYPIEDVQNVKQNMLYYHNEHDSPKIDKGNWNMDRLLRIPGTTNFGLKAWNEPKLDDEGNPRQPHPVRIIHHDKDRPPYSLEYIAEAYPKLKFFANNFVGDVELPPLPTEDTEIQAPYWMEKLNQETQDDDRSRRLFRRVARGVELGEDSTVLRAFLNHDGLLDEVYEDRADQEEQRIFNNVWRKHSLIHWNQDCWQADCIRSYRNPDPKNSVIPDEAEWRKWNKLSVDSQVRANRNFKPKLAASTSLSVSYVADNTEQLTQDEIDETIFEDFWTARPELSHIRQSAYAGMASPWAVLGAVLARVIAQSNSGLKLPAIIGGYASLNFFCNIVALSGGGKGTAEAIAERAFKWPKDVEITKPGSGEGLALTFCHRSTEKDETTGVPLIKQHCHRAIFSVPEVDTLAAQAQRNGSSIISELRSAFMGERLGFAYADIKKRVPVEPHSYRLCMIVGVQPARAGILLADQDGGLPQRFIWMPATDKNIPDEDVPMPEPMEIGEPFSEKIAEKTTEDGKVVPVALVERIMRVCQPAYDEIRAAARAKARGEGDPLDSHALLTREKVAAGLALLSTRQNNYEITEEDWFLADLIMKKSDQTRKNVLIELAKRSSAENVRQARKDAERAVIIQETQETRGYRQAKDSVIRCLTKANGEWTSKKTVRNATNSTIKKFLDDALFELLEDGTIEERDYEYNNQKGKQYRLLSN